MKKSLVLNAKEQEQLIEGQHFNWMLNVENMVMNICHNHGHYNTEAILRRFWKEMAYEEVVTSRKVLCRITLGGFTWWILLNRSNLSVIRAYGTVIR